MIKFELNKLPSYNEYINACRHNRYKGAKMKQDIENDIMWQIKAQISNAKILVPVKIKFIWIEKDYRRDLDNVCSAKKMIIDSMVKLQLIPNDNRKYVAMLEDVFPPVEKQTKVIVEIMEV